MSISRRVFVKSGGVALFSLGMDPLFLARAAFASYRPLPPVAACCRPVLVCLFQRGAVDGLNMIVPHGDPIYYQERPRIAVPEKDVLDLDGYFGLHPGLAALKPLWEAKTLAAIHATGSPAPSRSCTPARRQGCSRPPLGKRSTRCRCSSAWTPGSTGPPTVPITRAAGWEKRCSRSPSSSRPISGSRWRSRT